MSEPLIPPRALFRFAAPCRYRDPLWTAKAGALDESFRLPNLGELDRQPNFADVRAAWSEEGLLFLARVAGKRRSVVCDERRLTDSDGLQIWIDTRATPNIHRATRFCHRFVCLPSGGGRRRDEPVADQLLINRARENARPVRPGDLKCRSERRVDGYVLELWIPSGALTGFDPSEHPRLGFTYLVLDQELGEQTFTVGSELPFDEDPSLWGTLELVK
jgi:hypothetical protein